MLKRHGVCVRASLQNGLPASRPVPVRSLQLLEKCIQHGRIAGRGGGIQLSPVGGGSGSNKS